MKQCDKGHFYDETRDASCRYCLQANQGVAATVGIGAGGGCGIGPTVPVRTPSTPAAEVGATVGVMKAKIGADPVVAFVVATVGPHRGEDFRIRGGRTFIGRSTDADIALTKDDAVSRDTHALISYDPKANEFLIAPGQSRGITYRNGHQVAAAERLIAHDTIEVGATTLVFLPLCGPQFQWE